MAKHKFTEQAQKEVIDIMTTITNNNIRKLEEGKTISISDLPDCIHKSRYVNIVQDAKEAKVVAIAVLREVDDTWEAYIGWPDVRDLKADISKPSSDDWTNKDLDKFDWLWFCENIRDVEQVRMLGDKLSEEVARQLFNDWWDKKEYRHEKDDLPYSTGEGSLSQS